MDIIDVFANCTYEKPKQKRESSVKNPESQVKKYDAVSLQARTLDTQYNQWLKQKQGMNYERVSFNTFKESELYNENEMEFIIDNEVTSKLKNKKWNSLTKSMKWSLIQKYCEKNEDKQLNIYKKLLEKNTPFDVVYDNIIGEIKSILLTIS
jgi:hypothetical protein